jgi:hypothetical protein
MHDMLALYPITELHNHSNYHLRLETIFLQSQELLDVLATLTDVALHMCT